MGGISLVSPGILLSLHYGAFLSCGFGVVQSAVHSGTYPSFCVLLLLQ